MALLIVGCSVVDVIFTDVRRLPAWPTHTEFTPRNLELVDQPPLVTIGGNGANAAYAAAQCGAPTLLHSNLGRDTLGEIARRWLVDSGCKIEPGSAAHTAVNVTVSNARLQRATVFYPGSTPTLPTWRPKSATRNLALVCGWPHPSPAQLARHFRLWQKAGVFTAIDAGPILGPAPTLTALSPALAHLDLFLANEHEVLALTRKPTLAAALVTMRRHFSGHVVIKLGARGATWLPAGQATRRRLPGQRVRAINTVGAGDVFNGVLLAALTRSTDFPAALRQANAAAASVVSSSRGVLGLRVPRRSPDWRKSMPRRKN